MYTLDPLLMECVNREAMFLQLRPGFPPKVFVPVIGSIELRGEPLTSEQSREICYEAISIEDQQLFEYYQELHSTVEVKGVGWFGIDFSIKDGGVSGAHGSDQERIIFEGLTVVIENVQRDQRRGPEPICKERMDLRCGCRVGG